MSRRLLLPLLGAFALLTGQGLVKGQYSAPCPPGYPAYPYAPSVPTYPPGSYYPGPQSMPGFPGTSPLPAMPAPAMPSPNWPPQIMPGPGNPLPQPTPGNPSPTPTPTPTPGNPTPTPTPTPGGITPTPTNTPPATPPTPSAGQGGGDTPAPSQGGGDSPMNAANRSGSEDADVGRRGTAGSGGLPTVGDFFGVRYRRAFIQPVNRTISYSLYNPTSAPLTIGVQPPRSGGVQLNTGVTLTSNGLGIAVPPNQVTNVTLAPGASALVTGTGVVPTVSSFIDFAVARGAIKISDFETPRPRDRVYVGGWYYNNISDGLQVVPGPTRTTVDQQIPIGNADVLSSVVTNQGALFDASQIDTISTQFRRERAQLTRQVVGFEKTLELGGIDGSFGMRLPFFQFNGGESFKDVGDLSLIWKAIVCGGFETEDVVTVGLIVTLPTGPTLVTPEGNLNSVLVQPWMGYYYSLNRCYVQGFNGLVIPSETRDVGFAYSNVTLGYKLYESCKCNPCISFVAAQIEGHATVPFEKNGPNSLVLVNNFFVATGAVHVGFGDCSMLTVGCGSPFGGYRPYEFEASAVLNFFF